MDIGYMVEIFPKLIATLPITLSIIITSAILGLLLSIGVTALRIKKIKFLSPILEAYISFMRSVPILLLLFIVYYGLPVFFSLLNLDINDLSGIVAAMITLIIFNGAYLSEILRPAYLAIDKGQHEAANSLGYTPFAKFRKIVVPQMAPIALPGLGNAVIYLIHDTSLVFTIGVVDILGKANLILASSYGENKVEVYLTIALIYWGLCLLSDRLVKFFENHTYISKIQKRRMFGSKFGKGNIQSHSD
ncbi:amino acid ABC transporter permease [Lysinibacillus yapensis]|uniref:Amino acid ABC transporter permease n=1 Tax=Ureibacillus yapensis TaxID=2304605 RepID=A0A396S5R5_9BACL|nr:amino acid ABC transporter permease [Lysinibacillus yapensis]RHW35843.1 amino acid ABC transporter permease [Lysinibacillus yapensis]